MDVDGGNTNSHILTGLINGLTYTISIVGTSSSSAVIPSAQELPATVGLGNLQNRKQTNSLQIPFLLLCHLLFSCI